MVQVKLIEGENIIFDLLVGINVLRSTLDKLGDYVLKNYDVKSTKNQAPSKDNPEGYFLFECSTGEVKITTSIC